MFFSQAFLRIFYPISCVRSMLRKSSSFFSFGFVRWRGRTANRGLLISWCGTSNVWDIFSNFLPHARVSSADLKRAAQSLRETPNSVVPGFRRWVTFTSSPPTCRFETTTASSTSTCCFASPLSPQDLRLLFGVENELHIVTCAGCF